MSGNLVKHDVLAVAILANGVALIRLARRLWRG